jgi:hypothetical protein
MSGTFPTDQIPSSIRVQDNRPTLMNHSASGRRVVRAYGSQYWTLSVTMPPLNQTDAQEVFSFLQKQRNSFESFVFTYPIDNLGAEATSGKTVSGAHSVGDSTIDLTGFSASTTGVFKAGDYIRFFTADKVYMITEDADSDASGNTTVTISPSLVEALSDSQGIDATKPDFTVYLTGDVTYSIDTAGFYYISFELREVIG